VQNGYPNSEILAAIGNKAVVMVVNAGFSLDKQGMKTVTNKSEIDLPYGSLSKTSSREKLQEEIGQLFLGNPPGLSARCDDNIIVDIMKKTQYACIGAYCAVEAFLSHHPRDQKFTFGNLVVCQKEEIGNSTSEVVASKNAVIEEKIFQILQKKLRWLLAFHFFRSKSCKSAEKLMQSLKTLWFMTPETLAKWSAELSIIFAAWLIVAALKLYFSINYRKPCKLSKKIAGS
jgi:hypothetical protein